MFMPRAKRAFCLIWNGGCIQTLPFNRERSILAWEMIHLASLKRRILSCDTLQRVLEFHTIAVQSNAWHDYLDQTVVQSFTYIICLHNSECGKGYHYIYESKQSTLKTLACRNGMVFLDTSHRKFSDIIGITPYHAPRMAPLSLVFWETENPNS